MALIDAVVEGLRVSRVEVEECRLRKSRYRRTGESTQEDHPDLACGEIPREIESAKRCPNCLKPFGASERARNQLPKSSKYLEILVSAEGFEPSTHALKGHCSTN